MLKNVKSKYKMVVALTLYSFLWMFIVSLAVVDRCCSLWRVLVLCVMCTLS